MKKAIKITGIVIIILLAILIITPIAFKGQIVELVKKEINENVDAKVDFGTFRISLIRNFPNISLRINDLEVTGIDEFEDVKLADIGSIFVTIDIMTFISGDGYEVRSIRVDDPDINVIILEDGTANWNIMVTPEEEEQEEVGDDEREPSEFKLALQNFEISGGNIIYDDAPFDVFIDIKDLNHKLQGDFTADFATLSIPFTTAESFTLRVEGIPVVTRTIMELSAEIDVNFSEWHFTFRENLLTLNDLPIGFDGNFAMPPGEDMVIDLTFSSPKTDIKSFISLIPAIYARDFETIQSSGDFALEGYVNGILSGEIIPSFGLNVLLEDGEFSYPELPESVTDIQLMAEIINEGQDVDNTIIDISTFGFKMADNFISSSFSLKTPISDPDFDFMFNGDIDLSDVDKFYPLQEGESLTGAITGDMIAKGKLSLIEAAHYDQLEARGNFEFRDIEYQSPEFDELFAIKEIILELSPRRVNLESMECSYGETRILANGNIDNIFGHMFDDQLLRGTFGFSSNYIDLNHFMAETPEEPADVPVKDSEPMELSIIELPANIDFTLNSRIDQLLLGDIQINSIEGVIRVIDEQVRMDNLGMNLLDGSLTLSGAYSTQELNAANIDFSMAVDRFDIQSTFNAFNTFQILAPVAQYSYGKFSAAMNMESTLDNELNPVLETLEGGGHLSTHSIRVEEPPTIEKIAENLQMENLKTLELDDFDVSFEFYDGSVRVDPFDIKFGNSSATVEGRTYFDQTIDYNIVFTIPREAMGESANQYINGLVSEASAIGLDFEMFDEANINAKVTGTFTDPEVSIVLADMMKHQADDMRERLRDEVEDIVRDEVDEVEEEVREEVEDVIDDAREEVGEELERRAEQVVMEAHQQADRIREESKSVAERVRQEAKEQAERLEEEASGLLAEAAARRAGEELIKEAEERASQLEEEGETRAQRVIEEAEQKAERIREGEE